MSLNWSISDLVSSPLGKAASPSLGSVTVPSIAEGNYSPPKIESSNIGETDNIGERECTPVESTLYPEKSLLPSSNVEEHSVSNMAGIKTEMQGLHSVSNSTVSAAADSSDNQPPTPTPEHQPPSHHQQQQQQHHHQQQQQQQQQQQHHHHHHQQHPLYGNGGSIVNSNQMYQDMHSYHPPPAGSYLGGYEQFYHASPAGMDYGSAMQQLQQNPILSYQMQNQPMTGASSPHGDYKVAPSSQRFHPYLNNGAHHHLSPAHNHSSAAVVSSNSSSAPVNNTSSSVSNSSLSPRVVSSSSPSHNNSAANTPHHGMSEVNSMTNRTPTPSAASKQCNKCGLMCVNEAELNDHYAAVHGAQPSEDCITSAERSASSASERSQFHPFAPYIKEEPPSSDILDLDSQKMVYPPQPDGEVLNPGMHPMQRPMSWPQELHPAYMPAPPHMAENKHAAYYPKSQQEFTTIKNEFHPIKSEYVSPTNFPNPGLKPTDYGQPIAPQSRPDEPKSFTTTDLATGQNPVSSSPSEFPSTTTPQDNLTQYRGFEPPTSSLPSSGASTKSATWKSNEARRPKTYNCTACNKWFTSSGHLKRHYNTTLHKNAVKSSGQPDPATMPISAHHHPSRDPNSKHSRNSQSRQPPPIPPEPPRSPDFSSQYSAQSPNGFPPQSQQQQQSQAFQQYHPQSNLNSTVNGHPNGLAGPSVQTSQPRGLLTISSTEVSIMDQEEDQLLINSSSSSSNNNLQMQEDQYHQQQEVLESSPNNSPHSHHSSLEEYQSTINLQQQQQQSQQQQLLQSPHIISHHQYREVHPIHHQQEPTIFNTGTTIHNIMDQQQQQPPPQQQQQQYIISPLAINTTTTTPTILNNTTTIPSFQHLQQPGVELQQSYHTIIGNDGQPQDANMIQLSPYVDISQLTSSQGFQGNLPHQMAVLDSNGHIVQIIQPTMADMQRFSGGVPTFKDDMMSAASPAAPDSYYHRMSPYASQNSPQEADIPPMHTIAAGPQSDLSNPYSPTVSSSTTTTTNQLLIEEKISPPPKRAAKRKRETTQKAATSTTQTGTIRCEECNKEFTKICYLTQHNKSFHSGEQPYRCQKCGKRFHSEDIYEAHLEKHKSQDKPHKCDLCPKQFHHKTDLRRHKEAIHTGFKAHICDMCKKSFCRKDHLRKHCDIHNRPKPVKKVKMSAASRKQPSPETIHMTEIYHSEHDSPIQLSNIEDSTNSSSSQSHLMPKLDIKVESYTMAGDELVYM